MSPKGLFEDVSVRVPWSDVAMMMRMRTAISGVVLVLVAGWPGLASGSPGPAAGSPQAAAAAANVVTAMSSPGRFTATYRPVSASLLSTMDSWLPTANVGTVLEDPDRTANPRCASDALPLQPAAQDWFCLQSNDEDDAFWDPQGITTSGEASPTGLVDGHRAVVISDADVATTSDGSRSSVWGNTRLAFADYNDPSAVDYRWVYLVEPYSDSGSLNIRAAKGHAGGIAWYGHYMFVSDLHHGVRVFDTNRIYQLDQSTNKLRCDTAAKTCSAYKYKYAMAEVGTFWLDNGPSAGCGTDRITDVYTSPLCMGWVSMDESGTTPALIVGEYEPGPYSRFLSFPIGSSGLPQSAASAAWLAQPGPDAYQQISNINGGIIHDGTLYLARNKWNQRGRVYRATDGQPATGVSCEPDQYSNIAEWAPYQCWSGQTEAMSLDNSTGLLWSVTEKCHFPSTSPEPGSRVCPDDGNLAGRVIFAVPFSAMEG